jgi:hypothetical protein
MNPHYVQTIIIPEFILGDYPRITELEFCHKDGGRDIREERGDLEEVGGVGFRAKGISSQFYQGL